MGTIVVEISRPRIPCRVFAGLWQVSDVIERFTERWRPGALLRALLEGHIGVGDPIETIRRPEHGVTVGGHPRGADHESDLLPLLADVPELPDRVRAKVHRRLGYRSDDPLMNPGSLV